LGVTVTIPPSIGLTLYGSIGEASIGRLFLAGVIPGLLMMDVIANSTNSTKPTARALSVAAWDAKGARRAPFSWDREGQHIRFPSISLKSISYFSPLFSVMRAPSAEPDGISLHTSTDSTSESASSVQGESSVLCSMTVTISSIGGFLAVRFLVA
jgi:hypothetical protein